MEKTDSKLLVEKWQQMIQADKDPDINAAGKLKPCKNPEVMAQLLESQESWLNEASSTALSDIAQYTPILVPAVRRIFPNLLANDIVGVQPMSGPTGYAYALRFSYEGTPGKLDINGEHSYPTGSTRPQFNTQAFGGAAIVVTGTLPAVVGEDVIIDANGAGADGTTTWGKVAYAQTDAGQGVTKILINLRKNKAGNDLTGTSITFKAALDAMVSGTSTITAGGLEKVYGTDFQIVGFFNNEAGYNLIFGTAVTGAYGTTAAQEYLTKDNMKSMKMGIEKTSVEAQTRKLKAEYSIELAQDLKNVHGLDAEGELINIMEYEIAAELDRDLVEAIHVNSTNAGTWAYGSVGVANNAITAGNALTGTIGQSVAADGRNELEKFRTLYTRIIREANAVALSTRRGAANFIIASLNVVSALETLSNFMYAQVPGNVEPQIGVAKVGTLDGRFTVYLDTFAFNDFFIVGYKGSSAFDTGIVYCPYVPLQIQKIIDPTTFQPVVGFMTRDAITGSLFGASKYYRKVTCNFANSSFISGQYYLSA